jgi:predicted nucleic acid-binding Zn ribbon protein
MRIPVRIDAPRLWRAVLFGGLDDLASPHAQRRAAGLAWVIRDDDEIGSPAWLCRELDLDLTALRATRLVGRGAGARYQHVLGHTHPECFFCHKPVTRDRLYCDQRCRKREEWRRRRQRRRAA